MVEARANLAAETDSLSRHIRDLSRDLTPRVFAPAETIEDLETLERCRAEAYFQFALCRRIWWGLTPADRDAIRTIVLAEHPYYRTHPEGHAFQADCFLEVSRYLRQASPSFASL